MLKDIQVKTAAREQMLDMTDDVTRALKGIGSGLATVFVRHTTAAITINEGADPDVQDDILERLSKLAPRDGGYRHAEGNSDAHIKSSLLGSSVNVMVKDGRPILGTWQRIFFCEFDGPRTRSVSVQVIS